MLTKEYEIFFVAVKMKIITGICFQCVVKKFVMISIRHSDFCFILVKIMF